MIEASPLATVHKNRIVPAISPANNAKKVIKAKYAELIPISGREILCASLTKK